MAELAVYDNDPTLYLFTSLTAGSSHIVTATSRIETILKANKIPFKGVDTATDDLARKLYGRRASGKKLPLLVKEGFVIADLEQVEEWNEYDELKEALGVTAAAAPVPSKPTISTTPAPAAAAPKENTPSATPGQNLAIRQMGAEAAKVAASKKPIPAKISTTNPLLSEKVGSGPSPSILDGMMSPRFVPLPRTPNPPGSAEPSISYVKSPTPEPQATITETLAKVEAKKVEDESSGEEDEDEEEEDEEDEEKKEVKAGDKNEKAKPAEAKKTEGKKTEEKTQDQGAKDADKAGESVKD